MEKESRDELPLRCTLLAGLENHELKLDEYWHHTTGSMLASWESLQFQRTGVVYHSDRLYCFVFWRVWE